ncbi:MAG: DivIVA domain-containing protein [Nitrospirae bacterium]|nr:DivIVA domain-containing protein [Nitrospirota bacterium]MCL5286208.1 DivIVA domain-containing protein [Nitrospirota bacterium]
MLDHTRLNDLRSREFGKSLRGYATGEVDDFIENLLFEAGQLVDTVGTLTQELREIQAEKEEIKRREEQLAATLVAAQSTAEEWKAIARKEGEQIVRAAHLKSEEILQHAQQEALEQLRQARDKSRMEEESQARLRRETALTVARLKGELSVLREAMDRWEQGALEMTGNPDAKEKEILP